MKAKLYIKSPWVFKCVEEMEIDRAVPSLFFVIKKPIEVTTAPIGSADVPVDLMFGRNEFKLCAFDRMDQKTVAIYICEQK